MAIEIKKSTYIPGTILRDHSGQWDSLKALEKIPFGSLVEATGEMHCQVATTASKDVYGIALVKRCNRGICDKDYLYAYYEGEDVDIAYSEGVIVVKIEEDAKEWNVNKPLYVKDGKLTSTKEGEVFAKFQEVLDEKNKLISVWKV